MALDIRGPFGKNREAWTDYAVASVWVEDPGRGTNKYQVICKLCGEKVDPGNATSYHLRMFASSLRNLHFLCGGCDIWVLSHLMRWRKMVEERRKERRGNNYG